MDETTRGVRGERAAVPVGKLLSGHEYRQSPPPQFYVLRDSVA